jgi:hypothetical protein
MQAFAQLHGVSFEVLQLFVWQQARPWLHADSGGMVACLTEAVLFAACASVWG